jgi:hypothetical protein
MSSLAISYAMVKFLTHAIEHSGHSGYFYFCSSLREEDNSRGIGRMTAIATTTQGNFPMILIMMLNQSMKQISMTEN